MLNKLAVLICGALIALSFASAFPFEFPHRKPADLSRLVVVGDSLSAGVQNFSLLDTQQPNGYAAVVARQAGTPLVLPLVPSPGAPNVLELKSFGPPPVVGQVTGTLASPRDNPTEQPTDLAVPGVTVDQALTLRPTTDPQTPVDQWANLVLGFPTPFVFPGPPQSQIEQAAALRPTTIIIWLGNNDALVPALVGALNTLTPVDKFNASYDAVLDRLKRTGASLVIANIPDVTEVPFFTPLRLIAAQAGIPVASAARILGVGRDDFLRPSALPLVQDILSGKSAEQLPKICPAPLSSLPVAQVPCVLTGGEAFLVRVTIDIYNADIALEAALHGAALVNIHSLVNRLSSRGYQVNGMTLTTGFFGGLFSLDGIHPTNTGYAIIANEFIRVMNRSLNTRIPAANVAQIAAEDPLVGKGL